MKTSERDLDVFWNMNAKVLTAFTSDTRSHSVLRGMGADGVLVGSVMWAIEANQLRTVSGIGPKTAQHIAAAVIAYLKAATDAWTKANQ